MENIDVLISAWVKAKAEEQAAVEWRRTTEDRILKVLSLAPEFEGTENFDTGDFKLKIVGRHNRKIDAEKLQLLAAENGLSEHLSALFRWKPDINAAAWKAADESITNPLLDAITTTPGRPSFAITPKDQ
jgi:hypothetical protein